MKSSIAILLLLLELSAIFSANAYKGEPSYRLNTNIQPKSYRILLKPYLLASDAARRFTFDGEVFIIIKVRGHNVSEITLNAHLIEITSADLTDNGVNPQILLQKFGKDDLNYDQTAQKLTLKLEKELRSNGIYLLHFLYTGKIRDDQKGFFHINYTDSAGTEKYIGITQARPTNARSIFPCFDEPSFKAGFSLEMSRPANYNTHFNVELLKTVRDGEERFWDRFAYTPVVPPYSFAFILSDFVSRGNDTYKIITNVEQENKTRFAFEAEARAKTLFNYYFEIPYNRSMISLQMAGVPKFPLDGMENWGLMIYRDDVLVHEPDYTDGWTNKQLTISAMFHDIASIGFSNSVTFSWWSHFWLSEAFARYYQYFMAHKFYSEYHLDDQFVVNEVHLALSLDASSNTQPLTNTEEEIQTPSEIGYKLSTITSAKGACIIRMIVTIMGQPNFDRAIKDYLKEFLYQSVTPADLFEHLERNWPSTARPTDLNQFFYDWTEKVGYPVLFVNTTVGNQVTLSQKRFLYDSSDGSDKSLTYTIPITYITDDEGDFTNYNYPRDYFSEVGNMTIYFQKPFKWIIFNLLQSNYYRVFYDKTNLFRIKFALNMTNHSGIPPANRAQLIDDLFNFAHAAMLDYETVFNFLGYLVHETDYLPWHTVFSNLPRITQRLTTQQQKVFASFLESTIVKVYVPMAFTLTNLTVLDTYNRINVINWACKYNLFTSSTTAQLKFADYEMSGLKLTPDFREPYYCCVAREGSYNYYQTLEDLFRNETLVSEKKKIIRAMGCTQKFYEYHFENIVNGNIPSEYAIEAFTSMYTHNPVNLSHIFVLITNSLERFAKAVGGYTNVENLIDDMANYFTTYEEKKLLEDFVKANGSLFEYSALKLRHTIYVVETNLKWAERRLPKLLEYLKKAYQRPNL